MERHHTIATLLSREFIKTMQNSGMKTLFRICIILFLLGFVGNGLYADQSLLSKQLDFPKAYRYNFYGISAYSGGNAWVVGSSGMICRYSGKNSKEWVVQDSGTVDELYDVCFITPEVGWIVGRKGLIIKTANGGKTWFRQDSQTNHGLFSVSFKGDEGWAVGEFGTILHTENGGKVWSFQSEKVDKIYNNVFFTDNKYGWIVGELGTILHTQNGGDTWEEQKSPAGETNLFGVFFKDRFHGWIVGMDGTMLKTIDGGLVWAVLDSPVREHLFSIQVFDSKGIAVGLKGACVLSDDGGETWRVKDLPTGGWLKRCFLNDVNHGWVVGSRGTILETNDGGLTWEVPRVE